MGIIQLPESDLMKWAEEVRQKRKTNEIFEAVKDSTYEQMQFSREENRRELIKHHEGYHGVIKRDTDGFLVGGYGTKIPKGSPYNIGDPISKSKSDELFEEKWYVSMEDAQRLVHWFDFVPERHRAALHEMSYILGYNKFKTNFKGLLRELDTENPEDIDWNKAADHFKYINPDQPDKKYYKVESRIYRDIGVRGPHIYSMLKGEEGVEDILLKYRKGVK